MYEKISSRESFVCDMKFNARFLCSTFSFYFPYTRELYRIYMPAFYMPEWYYVSINKTSYRDLSSGN